MIILTTRLHRILLLMGLPVLMSILVAFQSLPVPKPVIKVRVFKQFDVVDHVCSLQKYTQTKYNIHGEIIEYAKYEPDSSQTLQELKILKYNPQGLLVGTMIYNQNNALVWSEEYQYNNKEQLIKKTQLDYTTTKSQKSYQTLDYDQSGRLVNTKSFNIEGIQIQESNKVYSDNGELLSSLDWTTNKEGDKGSKKLITIENQYNHTGQLTNSVRQEQVGRKKIKDIKIFENCAIVSWTKLENGKLISHFENKQKEPEEEPEEYLLPPPIPEQQNGELEYDDDKRDPLDNIEHKAYRTISRKLNKQGNLAKKIIREYNQVVEVVHYTYNEKKQLVKKRILDKVNNNEKEIQYQYDQYHNVVQSEIFQNGEKVRRNRYSYEYYYQ